MKKFTLQKTTSICCFSFMLTFVIQVHAQSTYIFIDGAWNIGDSVTYHVTNWAQPILPERDKHGTSVHFRTFQ